MLLVIKKYWSHVLIIFMITYAITLAAELLLKKMWVYQIAFPEQSALDDFEFEDFIFSKRTTGKQRDKNIVMINIGSLSRREIAQQVRIINELQPKVIGIEAVFNCVGARDTFNCPQLKDTVGNQLLSNAIAASGKVVLISILHQTKNAGHDLYDSIEYSDPEFSAYAKNGFANLPTGWNNEFDVKSCRSFIPTISTPQGEQISFAVEVAKMFEPERAARFLATAGKEPIINYRGNVTIRNDLDTVYRHLDYFETYDATDVLKGKLNASIIKDKIVILGYLGDYLSDKRMDAMFYSPLNVKPLGKSNPDMYGSVVQANIISMIIDNAVVNKISNTTSNVTSILIVLANIIFFIWLEHKATVWKEVFIILIPASQIILLALIRFYVFSLFSFILVFSAATLLLVSVSLATTLFYGPVMFLFKRAPKEDLPKISVD